MSLIFFNNKKNGKTNGIVSPKRDKNLETKIKHIAPIEERKSVDPLFNYTMAYIYIYIRTI